MIKCLYPWRSLFFSIRVLCLCSRFCFSHVHFILRIFTASVCVLSHFCSNPSFLGADMSNPLTRSGSLTGRPGHTLYLLVIVCQILDGLFHSLSITLLFRPSATLFCSPLRKCVVYRLPSVCLYGSLAASKLQLRASNLHFHTSFCLLVSHKQIVAPLVSHPIQSHLPLPILVIIDLPYRTKNGK